MANDLVITPENIASIRFSYKPDSAAPFAIKNFASIAVITTGGQYLNIGINEVLTYIKMLELKALIAADGTSVIAVESTPDVEKYTSIQLGIPSGSGLPVAVRLSLVEDDVCTTETSIVFTDDGTVTTGKTLYNNSGLTDVTVGFSFVNDVNTGITYALGVTDGVVGAPTGNTCPVAPLGKKYLVILFASPSNPSDQIEGVNDGANINPLPIVSRVGYNNAFPLDGQSINAGKAVMVDISSQVDEGVVTMIFTKSASTGWSYAVISYGNTAIGTNISDSGPVTSQPYVIPYDARGNGFVVVLVFSGGGVPSVGIPVNAGAANSSASSAVCTATPVTYYTDDGTITTGKTVFTDAAMTTPLTGFTFINSPDGNIYAINTVTGVVGATTGNTCTPPAPKNVFVVNNSGQPIVITTSQGSQAFAPAMNGNIGVAAADTVINDSITTRTFKFMQSLPSTIDPDVSLPNPITVAGGGTTIKVLSADISNLNYIIVT